MTYQALARKYRPRNFAEMVGQEHVLRALINALDNDRLHHAFLFTGTRGVGKTTIARILSRCLNCEQGVSSRPCGVCAACVEVSEGRFVDLIEVDAASRTKVEDTRELLENVQYAPTRGRYKVYLIDEVHMLSAHSFNALLKTLEEPPPHVKFLLATTDPQKLPITILSRCLQFNLKALPADRIAAHLQALLEREMIRFEPAALQLLGIAARGSMRDALSLTDQAIAFAGEQLDENTVRAMLGTVDREHVLRLLRALRENDAAAVLAALDEVMEQSPDVLALLDDLITALHGIAVAQAVPGRSDAALTELAGQLLPEQVQLWYDIALRGRSDMPAVPEPRIGLEMLLLRMVLFTPHGVLPEGGAAPAKKPARPASAPVVAPRSQAEPSGPAAGTNAAPPETPPERSASTAPAVAHRTASAPVEGGASAPEAADTAVRTRPVVPALPAGATDPGAWWAALVAALPLDGMVRSLAHHCTLLERGEKEWRLALDVGREMLASRERVETLQSIVGEALGQPVVLCFEARDTEQATPAQRQARERERRLQLAREGIASDPVVRELISLFDARLDDDSIEAD